MEKKSLPKTKTFSCKQEALISTRYHKGYQGRQDKAVALRGKFEHKLNQGNFERNSIIG